MLSQWITRLAIRGFSFCGPLCFISGHIRYAAYFRRASPLLRDGRQLLTLFYNYLVRSYSARRVNILSIVRTLVRRWLYEQNRETLLDVFCSYIGDPSTSF